MIGNVRVHKAKLLLIPVAFVAASAGGAAVWALVDGGNAPSSQSRMSDAVQSTSQGSQKRQLTLQLEQQNTQKTATEGATTNGRAEGPSVSQQSVTASSSTGNGQAQASVAVNGQAIALPQNGTVHRTIQSGNGSTNLDVSVQRSSTGDGGSSIGLDVSSSSESNGQ